MDIMSAYQQVGSYRAAAELCGTTHKTVKRVVEKFEAGESAPPRVQRAHNYDTVAELVAERVKKSQGRMSAKRMLPHRPRRRLRRVGTQLPPLGRRSESVVAQRASPRTTARGVVTG